MKDTDRALLELLQTNAREPTASLARKLGLSRTTVQNRMARLEARGIIAGYTVRLTGDYRRRLISAHVMISVDPKHAERVGGALSRMPEVRSLYAASGLYDLIAVIRCDTTEAIDELLDNVGRLPGIEKTVTSILLSRKFER